jgi:hypothetical protein
MEYSAINDLLEKERADLRTDILEFSKNYKCKICKNQPENAWCTHLLKTRTQRFKKRILEADSKLLLFKILNHET